HLASYLFSVVELVALRRAAPRPAAQEHAARRSVECNGAAAARGGVVAARQPIPLAKNWDAPVGGVSTIASRNAGLKPVGPLKDHDGLERVINCTVGFRECDSRYRHRRRISASIPSAASKSRRLIVAFESQFASDVRQSDPLRVKAS